MNSNESMTMAEIAFSNKKYEEALRWYKKVLETTPDDLYVLNRAGSICVPLGRFEEALQYFGHAKELDPNNGDVVFNYANACFFNKDNVSAFAGYVEAEKLGCSEDVTPRLYYQLALINSMRQDAKNALIYLKKCEEADKVGMIALTSDFISEKVKLFMSVEDYPQAEACAAQLVAVEPTELKNYLVFFGILMASKSYEAAEKVLSDALKYAVSSTDEKIAVTLQKAAVTVAKGDTDRSGKEACCASAIALLKEALKHENLTASHAVQIIIAIAEIYLKEEQYDKAIECLAFVLAKADHPTFNSKAEAEQEAVEDLSDEELEALIDADVELIREKIYNGELDRNLSLYTEPCYDENYQEYRIYDELTVTADNEARNETTEETRPDLETLISGCDLSPDDRERIYFMMLSSLIGKESFAKAGKYALMLKHSSNKYYSYFGRYSNALLSRKTTGNSSDTVRLYNESIAFFRARAFEDPTDSLASIFRARLYAESGKFEKAKELASLLSESDQKSVTEYIEECRNAN